MVKIGIVGEYATISNALDNKFREMWTRLWKLKWKRNTVNRNLKIKLFATERIFNVAIITKSLLSLPFWVQRQFR